MCMNYYFENYLPRIYNILNKMRLSNYHQGGSQSVPFEAQHIVNTVSTALLVFNKSTGFW